MQPIIYLTDGEKESRAQLVDKMATDIMTLKTKGQTTDSIVEIVSSSIIFTVMENMRNNASTTRIEEAVEDFLSAYVLILCRTMGQDQRN